MVAYQTMGNGPTARDLTVARVLRNLPEEQRVLVQPYKGVWRQVRVCHLPLFLSQQGAVTTDPSSRGVEESVRYSALVLQVELLVGGELTHSSAPTLSNRGWGLCVEPEEVLAHFRFAAQISKGEGSDAPFRCGPMDELAPLGPKQRPEPKPSIVCYGIG